MDTIKAILEKISSYNILTNIIPGAVLCVVLRFLVGYDVFTGQNWFVLGVIFYIIGVINNRFGSLVIGPFLKWIHFVNPCSYKDYIKAENTDAKVAILNTENNVFRSYIAVFTLSLIALLYKTVLNRWGFLSDNINIVILILLIILFASSYRKQTRIISQRVKIDKK
jgi:hypothetical protein